MHLIFLLLEQGYEIYERTDSYVLMSLDFADKEPKFSDGNVISPSFFLEEVDNGNIRQVISLPQGIYKMRFKIKRMNISNEDENAESIKIYNGYTLIAQKILPQDSETIEVLVPGGDDINNIWFVVNEKVRKTFNCMLEGVEKGSDGVLINLNSMSLSGDGLEKKYGSILADGSSDAIIYGPYMPLVSGKYDIYITYIASDMKKVTFDLSANKGEILSIESITDAEPMEEGYCTKQIKVDLQFDLDDLEIRSHIDKGTMFELIEIKIIPQENTNL